MDFILVVILFFIFLSLVGNSWVIFIIARRRRLQTTSNWFILSLAAADLGVTCVFTPYMICDVILDTCKERVVKDFAFFFVNVSAIGLIAMVAERYVAIVHSLKYVRVFTTTRRTFIIIGTCWGFPFLFTVLRRALRLAERRHSVVKTHIFDIIHIFLFVVVPTVLLLTAHFHILLIARKLSLQMRALMKQVRFNITANSLKIKEIRNVGLKASTVRLITVLVAIFTTCYGIRFYVLLCYNFKICSVSEPIRVINRLLLLANSTLNPLVYAFLKEDIKRETNAFLRRRRHLKTRPFQVHPE
ncbi:adenosine receptor A3-like [Pocillopora verrucosa]|uniref:adenosine receptor A3-like n=1 Tax=Pocillopora verrucosa TaxID=203993 RepID=UPI003340747C